MDTETHSTINTHTNTPPSTEDIQTAVLEDMGLTLGQYVKGHIATGIFGFLVIGGFLMNLTIFGAVIGVPMWIGAVLVAWRYPVDEWMVASRRIKAAKKAAVEQQAAIDVQIQAQSQTQAQTE